MTARILTGGGNDNGVEVVRNLGADEVVDTVSTSMAVCGWRRSFCPETAGLSSLVVDSEVGVTSGRVLRSDKDNAVVAVAASDGLAGEGRCWADRAENGLRSLVALEFKVYGLDDAVVLAEGVVADVDVLIDSRAGLAAVGWVGAIAGLGHRGCERSSEERGGDNELHDAGCFFCGVGSEVWVLEIAL
jgi:hypothetical protein